MATSSLLPFSLNPPALSGDDEAAAEENLPWVIHECEAYVAERYNATTAHSRTWDNKDISVTFFPRRPPRVSYLCVYSADAAEIAIEPAVLAMEEDLVLINVNVGSQRELSKNNDYYVYVADDGSGRPSLTHLPRPPRPYIKPEDVGILRYQHHQHKPQVVSLRRHDDQQQESSLSHHYIVASLHETPDMLDHSFVLCLYNSKLGEWASTTVTLNQQQKRQYGSDFYHVNCKVIPIGGGDDDDAGTGTMAFVDLWRGILFCDVLRISSNGAAALPPPPLTYVPLPHHKQYSTANGDARIYRDIAVVGGRLKLAVLRLHLKESRVFRDRLLRDGFKLTTFSRPATSSVADIWRQDFHVDSNAIKIDRDSPYLKLLPEVLNDEDMPMAPFKRLYILQPVLSLADDGCNIVYIRTNIPYMDDDAWVVAVDMKNKSIEGVAHFAAHRNICIPYAYLHSKISRYLKKKETQGTQRNLK